MVRIFLSSGLLLFLSITLQAQQPRAYALFDSKGTPVSWQELTEEAKKADVFFFGELHNNPICHWLQLEMLKSIHETKGNSVAIAMEMFETDHNSVIEEYITKSIAENYFESAISLWNNYATDYKPIVNYAIANELTLVGSNAPRRYAGKVAKEGVGSLETLNEAAQMYLPPLPLNITFEARSYQEMMAMMGAHGGSGSGKQLVEAQALKDATMAFIIKDLLEEEKFVYHINGAYHTLYNEGINLFLKEYNPKVKSVVLTSVEQENLDSLQEQHLGAGNYILVIPQNMTKTY